MAAPLRLIHSCWAQGPDLLPFVVTAHNAYDSTKQRHSVCEMVLYITLNRAVCAVMSLHCLKSLRNIFSLLFCAC